MSAAARTTFTAIKLAILAMAISLSVGPSAAQIPDNLKQFATRAEQGDAKAQWMLGMMYYHGVGVPENYTEAAKWYRKATEQRDASAQSQLGRMYYHGEGVPENYTEAEKWYRKTAEQGDAAGQSLMSVLYLTGRSVLYDDVKA